MSYTKTNWENLPSTNTPLNANNLNKIENALSQLLNASWQQATINSNNVSSGAVYYIEIGSKTYVGIYDLVLSNNVTNGTILATGLPQRNSGAFMIQQFYTNNGLRVTINSSGQLKVNYDNASASSSEWYGNILY